MKEKYASFLRKCVVCYNFSILFNINLNILSLLKIDGEQRALQREQYEDVNIMPCVRWQINFNPDLSNHIIKKHTAIIENQSKQLETAFGSKGKECKEEASPNIKVGMEFETMEDVYNFYNRFGRISGFSIRKHHATKDKSGMIKKRILVCSKERQRRHDKRDAFVKYRRDETRTGCTSYMRVILGMNGKYRISDFNDNHSHPLASPDKAHMLRSQRKTAIAQAAVAEDCDKSGIRPKSTYDLMSKQAEVEKMLDSFQLITRIIYEQRE